MIVSNLELIPGQRIVAHLGIVQGSTVRAKNSCRRRGRRPPTA
jgi:uncharacterized protein YbjQ (UPF0145 family)